MKDTGLLNIFKPQGQQYPGLHTRACPLLQFQEAMPPQGHPPSVIKIFVPFMKEPPVFKVFSGTFFF